MAHMRREKKAPDKWLMNCYFMPKIKAALLWAAAAATQKTTLSALLCAAATLLRRQRCRSEPVKFFERASAWCHSAQFRSRFLREIWVVACLLARESRDLMPCLRITFCCNPPDPSRKKRLRLDFASLCAAYYYLYFMGGLVLGAQQKLMKLHRSQKRRRWNFRRWEAKISGGEKQTK
jgi:hypothetical protein